MNNTKNYDFFLFNAKYDVPGIAYCFAVNIPFGGDLFTLPEYERIGRNSFNSRELGITHFNGIEWLVINKIDVSGYFMYVLDCIDC